MKAVVQRVKKTSLTCEGETISTINFGLVVYFGVQKGDTPDKAEFLARKMADLRIFEDDSGKMNLSVKAVKGEILAVSQFTLLADLSHGNRPGFTDAEEPIAAEKIYEYFLKCLSLQDVTVKKGVFGGDMKISQLNDGPVTIIYEI